MNRAQELTQLEDLMSVVAADSDCTWEWAEDLKTLASFTPLSWVEVKITHNDGSSYHTTPADYLEGKFVVKQELKPHGVEDPIVIKTIKTRANVEVWRSGRSIYIKQGDHVNIVTATEARELMISLMRLVYDD